MDFVIVTGMSGAGKSTALRFLEDLGFFCVDNLPPSLIPKFAEICRNHPEIDKIAIGVDIRSRQLFDDFFSTIDVSEHEYRILFLDSREQVLLKRYKETRRKHPLSGSSIERGIENEKILLKEIRQKSDFVIDTSNIIPRELKERINEIFLDTPFSNLTITVISFGFKEGMPQDADNVFDVRFIPNPFYVKELKEKTGNEKEVQDYVLSQPAAKVFFDKLTEMTDYLIPFYIKEDKSHLIIAIGCTGGKHRSVTLANKLYEHLKKAGHNVFLNHRDINRVHRI